MVSLAKIFPVYRSCIERFRAQSLPPPMRFSPSSAEPLNDVLRWVLRGHRIDIIEILRFPAISFILKPRTSQDTVTHSDQGYPAGMLRLAQEDLDNAVQRIKANAEGFLHRHQGSWLMIRSCTRSALKLLGARLKIKEHEDAVVEGWDVLDHSGVVTSMVNFVLPVDWLDAVVQVLEMLKIWEKESKDVAQLREVVEVLLKDC